MKTYWSVGQAQACVSIIACMLLCWLIHDDVDEDNNSEIWIPGKLYEVESSQWGRSGESRRLLISDKKNPRLYKNFWGLKPPLCS